MKKDLDGLKNKAGIIGAIEGGNKSNLEGIQKGAAEEGVGSKSPEDLDLSSVVGLDKSGENLNEGITKAKNELDNLEKGLKDL